MKILYAFQGTGNGHASKALEMVPLLKQHGTVDVLVSGNNFELQMPFQIKYKLKGITFYYNNEGGIDYIKSFLKLRLFIFLKEIRNLHVEHYDLVISDFEPVSVWACKLIGKKVIGFGHQASFNYTETPLAENGAVIGKFILKHYAPCDLNIGLHFKKYNINIFTPLIRKKIREAQTRTKKHVTVYLPAIHNDVIIDVLGRMVEIKFEVFSKHAKNTTQLQNITIYPANEAGFAESMINGSGIITHAGFETPAEALYLGKKLLCIPIKGQYEQYCNAESLQEVGVKVLNDFTINEIGSIYHWYHYSECLKINFDNNAILLATTIINAMALAQEETEFSFT